MVKRLAKVGFHLDPLDTQRGRRYCESFFCRPCCTVVPWLWHVSTSQCGECRRLKPQDAGCHLQLWHYAWYAEFPGTCFENGRKYLLSAGTKANVSRRNPAWILVYRNIATAVLFATYEYVSEGTAHRAEPTKVSGTASNRTLQTCTRYTPDKPSYHLLIQHPRQLVEIFHHVRVLRIQGLLFDGQQTLVKWLSIDIVTLYSRPHGWVKASGQTLNEGRPSFRPVGYTTRSLVWRIILVSTMLHLAPHLQYKGCYMLRNTGSVNSSSNLLMVFLSSRHKVYREAYDIMLKGERTRRVTWSSKCGRIRDP